MAMQEVIANRQALQIAVGVLALVPVGGGLAGALMGAPIYDDVVASAAVDSHHRYLSGLLLAIGIGFWSTVPAIERQGARFRLLTALVVIGGIARLLSLLFRGWPGALMGFALVMELAVTPLLCLWQAWVAKCASD
jgi:predicted MFS family arabinose efflux permease